MKALCIKDHEKKSGTKSTNFIFKKDRFYEISILDVVKIAENLDVELDLTHFIIIRKAVNSTVEIKYMLTYENFNEYFIVGEQSIRKYKLEKLKDLTIP